MKVTRVYKETAKAYVDGKRFIINEGGTRSSKTFSELQLIYTIAKATTKKKVITVVSHTLPHLEGGAIRDFDNILEAEGINIDNVRTKRPYIYTINNTTIEFIGFDKPGKALGSSRNILFINEANELPYDICHQLMIRTEDAIFIDYNPSHEFWIDTEGYKQLPESQVIHSTFHDNAENLKRHQLQDLLRAKERHDREVEKGTQGYWYNWWRVYGLGLKGKLEGIIFNNYTATNDFPAPESYGGVGAVWGVDFGFSPGKAGVVRVGYYDQKIWVEEFIYETELTNNALGQQIKNLPSFDISDHIIIADSAEPKSIAELRMIGLNVAGCNKPKKTDQIKTMQEFPLMIKGVNLSWEMARYRWAKTSKGEETGQPVKRDDHLIDAMMYSGSYAIMNVLYA